MTIEKRLVNDQNLKKKKFYGRESKKNIIMFQL